MNGGSKAFSAFAKIFETGAPQLISRELIADTQTPVSAYLKLAAGTPNSFLLESVEGGEVRGRFSVIGLAPDLAVPRATCRDQSRSSKSDDFDVVDDNPIESLRALMAESAMQDTGGLPPMAAGLFGYFGHDMIRQIETIPDSTKTVIAAPDSMLLRPSLIAIFDRLRDSITLVTQIRPADVAGAWNVAQSRLSNAMLALEAPTPPTEADGDDAVLPAPQSNMTKSDFTSIVAKARDYIRAGEIFQVVLSQRFSVPFHLPAFNLYRSLRRLNPSPFLFFFDLGGCRLSVQARKS